MGEFIDPEAEHGGIISGQIRDFTRRYGDLRPSDEHPGLMEDSAGTLWEPVDRTSVTSVLFNGMQRVVLDTETSHHSGEQSVVGELGDPLLDMLDSERAMFDNSEPEGHFWDTA